jgi:hypothetical protein
MNAKSDARSSSSADLEQMSVGDIAAALHANPNTIYSRLRAARADFDRADHPAARERPMEDPMTGLGPEAHALLEAARGGDEPTDNADRERVRAAIATRLAVAGSGGWARSGHRRKSVLPRPAGTRGRIGDDKPGHRRTRLRCRAGTLVAFRTSPRSASARSADRGPANACVTRSSGARKGWVFCRPRSSPAPATLLRRARNGASRSRRSGR